MILFAIIYVLIVLLLLCVCGFNFFLFQNIFGTKQFMENLELTMFGCDISDHEAIKNGIYHEKHMTKRDTMQMGMQLLGVSGTIMAYDYFTSFVFVYQSQ